MKAKYEMTRFDAGSFSGTAIVRVRATALGPDGGPVTYRKRVTVRVDGKPTVAYEDAPVFAEAERRLTYEGQPPVVFGLEAARAMRVELDDKLSRALDAHGLGAAVQPTTPKIDGPVELAL